MTDKRKHIKVTIPADMVDKFDEAKRQAEESAMMKMTDTQYASRVIQWAILRDPTK